MFGQNTLSVNIMWPKQEAEAITATGCEGYHAIGSHLMEQFVEFHRLCTSRRTNAISIRVGLVAGAVAAVLGRVDSRLVRGGVHSTRLLWLLAFLA